ncbi:SPOR domain-containing protein [Ferrimonas gelatinilytica]|uniref:SPOR domain-containing protein n=1 Tax=Ferrimonas gelatinilytica TaxID=1255257 RepID=A0ABP9SGZ1_9GAMM
MTRNRAGKGRSRSDRNRAGASRARRRNPTPVKSHFPWRVVLLLVALLCLFGYVLISIQGASEEGERQDSGSSQSTQQQTQVPAEPADPLPQAPTEHWEFIDTLPNKEVPIELPEQTQSGGPYQMQCGSFRTDEQAQTMRATIAFAGVESQVRRTEGSNGVWYRVVLGPYERKRNAEADRHRLQKVGINGCQIWNWN